MLFSTVTSATNNSSSSPPSAVQLYTTSSIDFVDSSVSKDSGHAILSYQAVEVPLDTGSLSEQQQGGLFGRQEKQKHLKPNWGVWNCRLDPDKEDNALAQTLLSQVVSQGAAAAAPAYLMTVDTADPSLVEPAIYSMQQTLVAHVKEKSSIAEPITAATEEEKTKPAVVVGSTSLGMLRTTKFGLAPNDESDQRMTPLEGESEFQMNLILCVIINSPSPTMTFQEKQEQALVTYHICRYAAALNCTLCFVNGTETARGGAAAAAATIPANELQKSLSVEEAAFHLRKVTVGEELENKKTPDADIGAQDDGGNIEAAATDDASLSAIYTSGRHDVELVESVLLRNAHCQGKWDASKDSLWVALPPQKAAPETNSNPQDATGDEVWLTKLKASVSAIEKSSSSAAKSKPAAAEKKEGSDEAVSSFFENLLKK